MSSYNSLPKHILKRIFNINTKLNDYGIVHSWKCILPLVSVCSSWRQVALPLVYASAYIDNSKFNTSKGSGWKTNLDLIQANGQVELVTSLNIDLHDNHSLLRFLKEASAYFNFGGQKWTNVQLLTIKFYKDMFIDDEEEFEEDTRSHQALLSLDMANFADALIEGVPNVSRLKLSTLKFSTLGDILSNHLANAYAPQFTLIKSQKAISFTAPALGSEITHLNLWLNPASQQLLPLINAEKLHCMHLFDVPTTFSWKYFYSNSAPADTIYFSNLAHLRLEFSEDCNDYDCYSQGSNQIALTENNRFTVHFPKLTLLRIDNSPMRSDLYYNNVYPEYIEKVEINYSIGAMELLSRSDIRSFDEFEFYSRCVERRYEQTFYESTNYFFSSNGGYRRRASKMSLYGLGFELNVDVLEWTGLTELLLFTPCNYRILRALVGKLKSLNKLVVDDLLFNDEPENKPLVWLSASQRMQPLECLDTKIQQLHIYNVRGSHCYSEAAANFIHRLIVQLNSLVELFAYDCHWMNLDLFTQKYQDIYPQLEKISITL